MPLTPEQVEQ